MSCDLIDTVNHSLAPVLSIKANKATPTPAPGPRSAKIICEEEYGQCVLVAPALPTLEHISIHTNRFKVLEERILVLPDLDEEPARDGLVVRAVRYLKGLAARAVAFVKKMAKNVQHLVGF